MRDRTSGRKAGCSRQRGFNLLELLVTIALAAILIGIAVPSLTLFVQNSRENTEADSLITSLSYARSEAVKRDANVEVCASTDGASCSQSSAWNTGWIVETTGATPAVLQVMPALGEGNTLTGSLGGNAVTEVTFQQDGFVQAAAGSGVYKTTYFTLCDSRGATYARDIEITATGAIEASDTPGETLGTSPQALTCP